MLIDHQAETYVEENILPRQSIRRLANGSIDYTFYDKRARTHRGVAFRKSTRSVTGLFRRIMGILVRTPSEPQKVRQPRIELSLTQPRRWRGDKCLENSITPRKSYSEAA